LRERRSPFLRLPGSAMIASGLLLGPDQSARACSQEKTDACRAVL